MENLKLGPDVLLKIVEIVQRGIIEQTDVSQDLRDLELVQLDGLLSLVPEIEEL